MRLLAGVLCVLTTLAPAAPGPDPASVVDGWKTSPLYVDPSQRSLVPDKDADRLAERVRDRDPAIRIAVVPAAALGDGSGDNGAAARAYVDRLVDTQQADGIYLVVFGGATGSRRNTMKRAGQAAPAGSRCALPGPAAGPRCAERPAR